MTRSSVPGFAIEASQSLDFARLSGDFNPLHVDPIAARRLQFGGTVCHGVHLVLQALDIAVAQARLDPARILGLHVVFQAPATTGQRVDLTLTDGPDRLRIMGSRDGRTLFSLNLSLGEAVAIETARPGSCHASDAMPVELVFEAAVAGDGGRLPLSGSLPIAMNAALFAALFPALAAATPAPLMAAELLATTRLVGMECPGLHSVYCELKLARAADDLTENLHWSVQKADPRFDKIRVGLTGRHWTGTLDAIFRDAPVLQPRLEAVRQQIDPCRFVGQRALVVGGSRGLGELVAKMLLAGGAEVTLSYANGRTEAEAIVAEAQLAGASCRAVQLDVSRPLDAPTLAHWSQAGFTHLYYFATPAITKGHPQHWSDVLFARYVQFYVHGLMQLGLALLAGRPAQAPALRVLVPSSVFVDQPVRGFAEYGAAKAAGEAAASHLALSGRAKVHAPRLPRLRTDQNSARGDDDVQDPLPVMDRMLRDLDAVETVA